MNFFGDDNFSVCFCLCFEFLEFFFIYFKFILYFQKKIEKIEKKLCFYCLFR